MVGEGFEQLDLCRSEGAHLGATCEQSSNEFPFLTKGNGQKGAKVTDDTQHWKIVLRGADIGNVERAVLAHPAILWRINTDLDAANGYRTKMSPRNHSVAVLESQLHVINPTYSCGAFHDRIEYRLHVGGRAADDTEYLGRCRLMLQGLAQFGVALA